jgi:hypothetical protein
VAVFAAVFASLLASLLVVLAAAVSGLGIVTTTNAVDRASATAAQ